ncbi:DNA repair exonuclease [Rhodohalobacter sp. SW132]|uniref:metallophosphoesterase family protein n=1 Tax=Rhodohalobacter sp. SW132 TaxID=2293433 RepID=UPI000E255AFA|nr:DNA repair exonuclease [Rhodohalobacter sp. SW132]REL37900.1 DNA repair exonuclease [Rhodohalobacter sp. SW132]
MGHNKNLKIFHTADFHLGLHFRTHPEAQETLVQARYETLKRLIDVANEKDAEILAIAGDLFDKTSMKVSEIQQAVQAINRFEGNVVLVLPGNHDYITADSQLWDRFKKEARDHVLVLDEKETVDLSEYELNAVVYPAPCHAKHSAENTTGWVIDVDKVSGNMHIGIAHGSIKGESPDFDERYFPMTKRGLEESGLDIWLLGHTHITFPDKPGKRDIVFNPGTPEPDGFDCSHEGRAFLHTIDEKKSIQTEILSTGSYRFLRVERTLNRQNDLEKLLEEFQKKEYQKSVVKLSVSGRLDPDLYDQWLDKRHQIRDAVMELKLDDSGLKRKVTEEQIRKEFAEGSFPEQLLSSIPEENEDELQMAYELIREVKG